MTAAMVGAHITRMTRELAEKLYARGTPSSAKPPCEKENGTRGARSGLRMAYAIMDPVPEGGSVQWPRSCRLCQIGRR